MRTVEEKARMWDAVCAENKIPCDVCKYEKFWDGMNEYSEKLKKSLTFYEEKNYGIPIYLKKTLDKICEFRGSASKNFDITGEM